MIAVVLAGGRGRRMLIDNVPGVQLTGAQRAAADAGLKAMMPMGEGDQGRPFLDYALERLADAGCTEVVLVVPPDHADVRAHYERVAPTRVDIRYAVQPQPTGTASAVLAAAPLVGERSFVVANGDNLYPPWAITRLVRYDGPEPGALVGFEQKSIPLLVERRRAFAFLEVRDRRLVRIVEKPTPDEAAALGADALMSMNLWRFGPFIFDACRDVRPSPRGELELPDAVRVARARGATFAVIAARYSSRGRERQWDAVSDLSYRTDIADLSRALARHEPRL